MTFSKSFGYALRGILYVALMRDEERKIPLDEIAEKLSVPRYFLGKIMKSVVKAGILDSVRGLQGGFYINPQTINTPLLSVISLTEGNNSFDVCPLNLRKCEETNPCPLHKKIEGCKDTLLKIYQETTIGDLLRDDKPEFIKSIATDNGVQ